MLLKEPANSYFYKVMKNAKPPTQTEAVNIWGKQGSLYPKYKFMKNINTEHLKQCIVKLEKWHASLQKLSANDELYEVYRSSVIKEFQIIIDQSQKLLEKKLLRENYITSREKLGFKYNDFFRRASERGLFDEDLTKRWTKQYYHIRNNIEHNYGEDRAEESIKIMNDFILDAKKLMEVING